LAGIPPTSRVGIGFGRGREARIPDRPAIAFKQLAFSD
jgi:hypothetical protein